MSEIAVRLPEEIMVPGTGELVRLADTAGVARALQTVREYKQHIDEVRGLLERALVEESTRAGTKTLRLDDGLVASIGPDSELEWDLTELVKLRRAGLPEERYAELVKEEVSYKVNAAVAKQIEAANPKYARIIKKARGRKPKRQSVKVEEK